MAKQDKRKRSVHGGGSVFQRQGDKRWVASIKDPETGKYIRRYAQTEKEANNLLEEIKSEIKQNALIIGPQETLGKYLISWFENIQKLEVRNTTYLRQEPILHKTILPALGHIPLRKLTPDHVQRLYTQKVKEGWKPGSVSNIHKILHKALKNAVRRRLVSQNVSDLVSLPRLVRYKAVALTKEQVLLLLKEAQGHLLEPLIILGLGVGMRHGEIGALRWQDINFEEHTLRVERTLTYLPPHGYIVGDPKTENSKRIIVLPRFVVQSLKRYQVHQQEQRSLVGARWQNLDLVFCNTTGGYRNPATDNRGFHRLLKRIGLPPMRIHDLRHSAATLLAIQMNVPANVVQELLGHDDIETTLGLYGHSNLEMQRKMMNDLDSFLGDDL